MAKKIEIGDFVVVRTGGHRSHHQPGVWVRPRILQGLVVGFNAKGEGGRNFIHVLVDGDVDVFFMAAVSQAGDCES